MPVKCPTADHVKQAFEAAIPAGQAFDLMRYDELLRAVVDPTWLSEGAGIQVLTVAGARLIRVCWEFRIDKANTNSETDMNTRLADLRRRLVVVVDGGNASFENPPNSCEKTDGPVTVVQCSTRGIIG